MSLSPHSPKCRGMGVSPKTWRLADHIRPLPYAPAAVQSCQKRSNVLVEADDEAYRKADMVSGSISDWRIPPFAAY